MHLSYFSELERKNCHAVLTLYSVFFPFFLSLSLLGCTLSRNYPVLPQTLRRTPTRCVSVAVLKGSCRSFGPQDYSAR
uniref:Uncharacterized protein n=1 Tax=Scophthalmus maximus TaxID=52904 RepID=A0A8D3DWK3_SCOMX